MSYTELSPESKEKLLWMVHDDFMDWLTFSQQRTVSVDEKLDHIILGLASLAKALAGGYRNGGTRT